MPGNCPLIRHLRDPDILTQPVVGQSVAPKKWPPEAYFPRRLSIIGALLTSDRLFTIIPGGCAPCAAFITFPAGAAPLSRLAPCRRGVSRLDVLPDGPTPHPTLQPARVAGVKVGRHAAEFPVKNSWGSHWPGCGTAANFC